LDFAAQKELHRVHLKIVHREVLPSSGENAQWETRAKDKSRDLDNLTHIGPRKNGILVPVSKSHRNQSIWVQISSIQVAQVFSCEDIFPGIYTTNDKFR
jgi:hypothetical protein